VNEPSVLSDKQVKAIASLERALKKCNNARLAIFGAADFDMCAFDAEELRVAGYGKVGVDMLTISKQLGQGHAIQDSGAYWDSIAW